MAAVWLGNCDVCKEDFAVRVTLTRLSQLVLWSNLIERSNNNIFKARTLQVPSYKLKHLDWREKQIKISNEQIRIHIRSSKPKTYKVKRNKISQFNKNITSKVYINNWRQIKSSLVLKSSSYQDVHPRLFWMVNVIHLQHC